MDNEATVWRRIPGHTYAHVFGDFGVTLCKDRAIRPVKDATQYPVVTSGMACMTCARQTYRPPVRIEGVGQGGRTISEATPAVVTRSSNPRRCAVCDEVKCGSVVLPDDTSVCDDCTVRELRNAIRLYAASRRVGDGCGCSDADGPCSRHEVDEEGPRGSEAADALRDSQAAAQRSR